MNVITKVLRTLSCLGMISFSVVVAADNAQVETSSGWRISLGASYRDFDAPDFAKVVFDSGIAYSYPGGPGAMTYNDVVTEVTNTPGPFSYTATRTVTGIGKTDSYTAIEGFSPILSAACDIWQEGGLSLSLVGGFQYFSMNSAAGESETIRTLRFNTFNLPSVPIIISIPDENKIDIGDAGTGWTDGAVKNIKKKFAMDLYVFDLGLSLNYAAAENLQVFVAGGPTLSIADMESSNGLGKSKNEVEFEYGVYMSCGGTYWFNETYGLSVEVRYDNCFGKVGTPFVKQDLDSASGMLKFVMKF